METRRAFLAALPWLSATAGLRATAAQERGTGTPAARPSMRLGYAAITWGGDDLRAIEEIAALGFRGIQLRSGVVAAWGERPQELASRLREKGLALLCFSSGTVDALPERRQGHLETHARHAAFVRALGGDTLQLISRRPAGRAPTEAEFDDLGRLLTEIGRRAAERGVRLVYHHHMDGFGEAPDEVARVLERSEPRYVSLLLDIAHYRQGGGDPVAAVERHRDRLAVVHLKDVVSPLPGDSRPARRSYRFVELGRGSVDVPGVVAALRRVAFAGPALIELDSVPEGSSGPAAAAAANKRYALEVLGLTL